MYGRMVGIVLAALVVVPVHVVVKALGKPDAVPPFFLWLVGRIAGLRVRTVGRVQPGALLLANHLSWLDILGLAGACRARFVAHSGLAGHGGLKWLCDQNRTVFITRDKRSSIAQQVAQVGDAIGARPLVIFPEATTDNGRELRPFRSSLLSAAEPLAGKVPIQPVVLDYADAPGIAWFDPEPGVAGESGMENVRRILGRKGRIDLAIRFLPPLSGPELENRKTMTAAAQDAISAALDLPVQLQ